MKITLKTSVWHQNKRYDKGETLDLHDSSGVWLIDHGAAEEIKPKHKKDAKDKPE